MLSLTIDQIKRSNAAAGGYFFSPGALRFFRSRILSAVFSGPGGVYFVTSERGPRPENPRRYSIRRFDPLSGEVESTPAGCTFQEFGSAGAARRRARWLADRLVHYQNKHGALTLERIGDFMPVSEFKRTEEHARYFFDLDTAEQIAVITENRGIQIAPCFPIDGQAYVLLHKGPSVCALCRLVALRYTGKRSARDVIASERADVAL